MDRREKAIPNEVDCLDQLRAILRKNPRFIDSVRAVIDEIPGEMPDETLFDCLKPRVSLPWPVSYGARPTVSPDSVNLFFYPWVRRKLQTWQATYLDQSLDKLDRDRAKDKIELVFRRFLFQGSGPKSSLSGSEISEIFRDRYKIRKICEAIIQDSLDADTAGRTRYQYREDQIINRFDWCAGDLGKNQDFLQSAAKTQRAEEMRASVLAIKYNCPPRTIKAIIREGEEGFREFKKLQKGNPNVRAVTIVGSGKNKKIRPIS